MHPSRRPMMAGNWKMYKTGQEAGQYVQSLAGLLSNLPNQDMPEVVLCAPFTALITLNQSVEEARIQVAVGAQTMSAFEEGAYTGDIAPCMLREHGVRFVILGHSERREYFKESDADVRAKIDNALRHHLTPIVCVGESLETREAGQTDAWVETQVKAAVEGLDDNQKSQLVFAYEPIWAIGTGRVCEADEAGRVCGLIRQWVGSPNVRVLYGGSMKPDNVQGLMAQTDVDGGLVGGASLDPQSFIRLIEAATPARV